MYKSLERARQQARSRSGSILGQIDGEPPRMLIGDNDDDLECELPIRILLGSKLTTLLQCLLTTSPLESPSHRLRKGPWCQKPSNRKSWRRWRTNVETSSGGSDVDVRVWPRV
jgi:hypothetical protein